MNKELCTRCNQETALVLLKTGENLCDFCVEDWIDGMWEEYGPGEVELDI